MDTKRVFYGTVVWSLGLFIPTLYHALLMNATVRESNYSYEYELMCREFFALPWIVWPYTIAMAVVGAKLVVSGIKKKDTWQVSKAVGRLQEAIQ